MKTAIINVKSTNELKASAKRFSRELGLSLSDLVNLALKQTLLNRQIVIDTRPVPNEETAKILRAAQKKTPSKDAKKFASVDEAFASL